MNIIHSLKGLFRPNAPKKKTLGAALGCGGAKGMAHLGILKALEEENIFPDAYAGSSIGSIVGALAAYGYTSDEMKEAVSNICLREYVRYIRPYMDMSFIENLLNEYLHGAAFSDLKKPFYAWATDEEEIRGVLLERGAVARACTASGAIPPYFHSVEIDGKKLIDGVYTNAVPADVLKEKGADFTIGVDLNAAEEGTPVHYYNSLTHILTVTVDSTVKIEPRKDALSRGYAACDFMFRPPLSSYTAVDAARASLQRIYDVGYETAQKELPALKEKLRQRGMS